MEASSGSANNNVELKPPGDGGKPEMNEDSHDAPFFQCGLCDKQITYKISQEMLTGLATACVDSTTGGLFKTPATVAVEIRKEMVDYLRTRSEYFVAESVVMEGEFEDEISDHPFDIISTFIDDFALSKRNFFSRVSTWALSDMREDKIDDFVQQMETNSFWVLQRREPVTHVLLRNVDFKSQYHCKMRFTSKEELQEHQETCEFSPVMCDNEGCSDTFSARHMEKHDSECPFKLLHCEQGCPEYLLRREMDRHCITVCPMKLASCTFYSVGCQYQVPQCKVKQHCSESRHSHLVNVLQFIHKEASEKDAQLWAQKIENSEFSDQLEARDVRSFTRAVKDIESRIGPFKVQIRKEKDRNNTEEAHPPSEDSSQITTDMEQAPKYSHQPSEDPPTRDAFPQKEDIPMPKQASESPSLVEKVSPDTPPQVQLQPSDDPPSFEQAMKESPLLEQTSKNPISPSKTPLSPPTADQVSEDLQQPEPPSTDLKTDSPEPKQASVPLRQAEQFSENLTPPEQ